MDEAAVQCPYCWETIPLQLDLSEGDSTYVQDCSVCCQPILVRVRIANDSSHAVDVEREND